MSSISSEKDPDTSGNELSIQATLRHESWILHEMGTVRIDLPDAAFRYAIKNQGQGTATLYDPANPATPLLRSSTFHRNWLLAKLGFGHLIFESPSGAVARLEDVLSSRPVLYFNGGRHPVEVRAVQDHDQWVRVKDLGWVFHYQGKRQATVSGAAEGVDFLVALLLANYFWLAAVDG